MSYRLSRRADLDLDALFADGVTRFGPHQANRYFDDLIGILDLIATQPRMARLRRDLGPPVRVHPHGVHLVFYREDGADVLIVRVLPARSNWARLIQL